MNTLRYLCLLFIFFVGNLNQSFAETFTFKNAGFAFEAPDGWHIGSQQGIEALIKDKSFGSDVLNKAVKQGVGRLLIITQNPINQTVGVNPGIFVDRHPGRVVDINAGLQNIRKFMIQNMNGWNQVGNFKFQKVGEFESGLIQYSYEVLQPQKPKLEVVEMLWLIPQDNHYITISSGFSPEDRNKIEPIITNSVSTLRKLN